MFAYSYSTAFPATEDRRLPFYAEQTETATFLVFDVEPDGAWRSVIVEGDLDRTTPDEWERAREAMADNAYRPDLLTDVDPHENPRVWALEAE